MAYGPSGGSYGSYGGAGRGGGYGGGISTPTPTPGAFSAPSGASSMPAFNPFSHSPGKSGFSPNYSMSPFAGYGGQPGGYNAPSSGPGGAFGSGYGPDFGSLMEKAFNEQAAITGAFPTSQFQYSPMHKEWGLTQYDPSARWQTMTGKGRTGKSSWWSAPMDLMKNISEYEIGSPFGSDVAGETIGSLLGIEGGDVSTVGDYAKTAMMMANPGMVVANKLWGSVGDIASGFQDAGSMVGQPGLMNLSSPEAQTGLRAGDVGGMSGPAYQPRTIRDVDVESMEQTGQNEYDAYMQEYNDYMAQLLEEAQQPIVPYQTSPRRTPMQTSSAWLTAENPLRGLGGIYG